MVDTALLAFDIDGCKKQRLGQLFDAIAWMKALDSTLAQLSSRNGLESTCFKMQGMDATGNSASDMLFVPISHDARHARIDHILLHAPHGFNSLAVEALERLRQVKHGTEPPVLVVLVDIGPKVQFEDTFEYFGTSRVWQSKTPLIVPARDSVVSLREIESMVRDEIGKRDYPHCVSVELSCGRGRYQSISVEHLPDDRQLEAALTGFAFDDPETSSLVRGNWVNLRLRFDAPVSGPVALGRWARYGMGLFLPCADG